MRDTIDWSYKIVRNVIPDGYRSLLYDYFHNKRDIHKTMMNSGYISSKNKDFGCTGDGQPGVKQDTYSLYGDIMTEMLMSNLQPMMERETNMSLVPSYGYMRIYEKGDELKPHKDRPACEISTTMNIGGDFWPIFLRPDDYSNKSVKADLNPGDLLIYRGCDQLHWREPFKGNSATQVFLHYNDINGPYGMSNKFDKRPHLGLPGVFRKQ